MTSTANLQDFSIVLVANNLSPNLMAPDFLNGSGVIPGDWELASQPVLTARASQIAFKNGIRIEAQPGSVNFSEAMGTSTAESPSLRIPELVYRYTAALPNLNYQGVGLNPRRFVTFGEGEEGAHRYLTETLLSPGTWQGFGTAPMQAGINLVYTLQRCRLRLTINEAKLQIPNQQPMSAIIFAGNFDYRVSGETPEERQQSLKAAVENWRADLADYNDLIDNYFLVGVTQESLSLFPSPSLEQN
jgi:hypothetical protein